jgi:GNAT superfamily N-acetyltransferase
MNIEISYTQSLDGIDWEALKIRLHADDFDNGRTAEQLQRSFANSQVACFALAEGQVVGKARLLSDGVCNAYLVDVWTYRPYRRRGIAREMIRRLIQAVPGQHIYLQADSDLLDFYERLGFRPQPHGLSCVVGTWLDADSTDGRLE